MTDEELLAYATQFTLIARTRAMRDALNELLVEARSEATWAIITGNAVLNHDGEWEHEPMPSHRSDDFIARTRWPSAREAIEFAKRHIEKYPSGYKEDYNSQ